MPILSILASQNEDSWSSTSGTITAVVVVLTFFATLLCAAGLYFLRRHALQYAKGTSRGQLQYLMSLLYVFLMCCSIVEASVSAWLLAQYDHQDRFPSVGTRDGLRIALFSACWTLAGASVQIFLLLHPPQWIRKHQMSAVVTQSVWTLLTWAVWVAATRTIQRASPLLSPKAGCAGADYCVQLHAAFVLALFEIAMLIVGMFILIWATWKITRSVPRRR